MWIIVVAIAAILFVGIALNSRSLGTAIFAGLLAIVLGVAACGAVVMIGLGAVFAGGEALVITLFEGIYGMFHLPFLILDGIFLWGALGVASILTLMSIEYEKPGWCTIVVLVTLAALEIYSGWHPITFAIQNPVVALTMVAAYFAAGTLWIVLKWLSHVYSVRDKFLEIKDGIMNNLLTMDQTNVRDDARLYWKLAEDGIQKVLTDVGVSRLYREAAGQLGEVALPLKVSEHKAQLYMWWLCWPLSLIWTFVNDPIKRIWHFVYSQVGDLLQNISNRAFKL